MIYINKKSTRNLLCAARNASTTRYTRALRLPVKSHQKLHYYFRCLHPIRVRLALSIERSQKRVVCFRRDASWWCSCVFRYQHQHTLRQAQFLTRIQTNKSSGEPRARAAISENLATITSISSSKTATTTTVTASEGNSSHFDFDDGNDYDDENIFMGGSFFLPQNVVTRVSPKTNFTRWKTRSVSTDFPNSKTRHRRSESFFLQSNYAFLCHLTSIFFFLPAVSHEHTFEHELFMDTFHTFGSSPPTFWPWKSLLWKSQSPI